MEFAGAAEASQITVSAQTWQIDFSARLRGIDEVCRLANLDYYGHAAFFGDGFSVSKDGDKYRVKAGLAYVGGIRALLADDALLEAATGNVVYADVSYQGSVLSEFAPIIHLGVKDSAGDFDDYTDANGFAHYITPLALITASGEEDKRDANPFDKAIDDINAALKEHAKSRDHPDATLSEKGFIQLSSAVDSDSETHAATSKAVKTANDAALKIANNLSEIAAAGPPAVLAAITNLNLLTTINSAKGALQLEKNLSDVASPAAALKSIGGFAVGGPLDSKNLNLIGNADEIGVWYQITDAVTENNNYPVRASGTLLVTPSAYGCQQEYTSYSGLKFVRGLSAAWNGSGPWQQWQQISAQQPKAVTTSDYIRIPDVPGGLIIQWFAGNTSMGEASMGPLSFPIAFPSACIFSSVSTLGNGTGACDQMFQVTSTNRNSITLFSQVFGSGSVPGTATPLILVIGY